MNKLTTVGNLPHFILSDYDHNYDYSITPYGLTITDTNSELQIRLHTALSHSDRSRKWPTSNP
jgi:hypothetical protein